MAKYKVVNQKVEINGRTREIDAIVDASEFRVRPADAPAEELSELDSLLATVHVVPVS